MPISDDEDESLVQFLESEVLAFSDEDEGKQLKVEDNNDKFGGEEEQVTEKMRDVEDEGKEGEEESRGAKRMKFEGKEGDKKMCETHMGTYDGAGTSSVRRVPRMIETGILSKIPPEMLHHILKFLSSEDLVACLLVCKFLNGVASDESLWRRLYCLRWGLVLPTKKPRECAWKKLYIKRDADDMVEFVRNCPTEFKEYYIQMQTAKRSQAPLLSQINDDRIILDKTVADQVYIWKKSKGLGDNVVNDHACSGKTCAYHQIGDVFVCEKTGNVHVCDDTCREVVLDPINGLLVCTISGHCLDTMLLLPDETEPDVEQQQTGAADELEPFMGSGRFARAYELGYNCDDEKELEAALLFC
ncbi:F-box protein SKIP31 isoform X2 [Nicotiana tomentosiformis]|uniref:F-box protein SKIP31 isoform X2 n=1 Tax=Nicotiana tomentosiformis TaxID=4098 RepID=UPI00051AF0CF|nr:F-box protein SKIP31 isoform X2 [Nicotiana tomentosiformis]